MTCTSRPLWFDLITDPTQRWRVVAWRSVAWRGARRQNISKSGIFRRVLAAEDRGHKTNSTGVKKGRRTKTRRRKTTSRSSAMGFAHLQLGYHCIATYFLHRPAPPVLRLPKSSRAAIGYPDTLRTLCSMKLSVVMFRIRDIVKSQPGVRSVAVATL